MRARPVGPRVLVKPMDASESATESGLVLPQEVAAQERRGIVVEVGTYITGWDSTDDLQEKPLPVAQGDMVIYKKGCGTGVRIVNDETGVGEDFVVLELQEVLLVLEEVSVHA